MFPTFSRPTHLHVANVHGKPGDDVTLLTTLQGIVNRNRPEIYLEFDPVDHTWLGDFGVQTTRHARPDGPRAAVTGDRVRGAIVVDPDVPDTVNVATTLAGLTGAVVATAAQAKTYGLTIVQDLRGKFTGRPGGRLPVAARRTCGRGAPTGCSPGCRRPRWSRCRASTWTEVGRETTQLRDGSNEATYTFDLSLGPRRRGGLPQVRRRLRRRRLGRRRWPQLKVIADGTTIAIFAPDTAEEAEVPVRRRALPDRRRRQPLRRRRQLLHLPVRAAGGHDQARPSRHLWNQYLVSGHRHRADPVESFPNFRDFVVATKAMVVVAAAVRRVRRTAAARSSAQTRARHAVRRLVRQRRGGRVGRGRTGRRARRRGGGRGLLHERHGARPACRRDTTPSPRTPVTTKPKTDDLPHAHLRRGRQHPVLPAAHARSVGQRRTAARRR